MLRDRQEAAERLAQALAEYRGQNPLVLAIPRGAVPMAKIIADRLGGQVDVLLVRKLPAPDQPELAIGAIDESGRVYLHPYAQTLGISADYLKREARSQMATLRRRRAEYTPDRAPIDPRGRIVLVVDDGIATGSTMIAALQALRERSPAKLVVATGVAPADTLQKLREYSDQVVCLASPEPFDAVGQHYEDFSQVSDQEVIEILRGHEPVARYF
ncbi:MAG TPA: phosphoribosyltransferase [bacterium]|nr:phosphoribosyltransferase [bacterium]